MAVPAIRRLLRAIAGLARATPVTGLHECPACRRDMVCPIHWETLDDERWTIELRCGECGLARDLVASNAQAADLDVTLDRQQSGMQRELGRLDAARMAQEVDAFIEALGRDLIGPADFAR